MARVDELAWPASMFDGGLALAGAADHAVRAVDEARAELDRLIASLSAEGAQSTHVGSRPAAPVYLIVANRGGLIEKYGQSGFDQLNQDLHELKRTIESQAGLEVLVIYMDDDSSLAPHGLRSVDPANPWQVKTVIDNLDVRLNGRGKEIRYVLIIGGDSLIPFHRLPNPIDDQDLDVPSDNPYASRDANYLIPERAVGRMPDAEGEGVGFLRTLIQTVIDARLRSAASKGMWGAILGMFRPAEDTRQNGHSLGYSASIWRKASRAVFEVIGENRQLRTSPPLTCQEFKIAGCPHFGYFNLHGVEEGANWYGQRDSLFPVDYPLFPVAMRPQDLTATEHAGSIVFTEACYGAHVQGKDTEGSIALRFLASQALALVGSTKAAYGAIAPPVLGADLIGRHFWEGLRAGLTVGDALVYAKVSLAKDMQDQQGYLDGEDHKSLISFVLYGDPALPVAVASPRPPARIASKAFCPPLVCQKRTVFRKGLISDEVVAAVKGRVEADLPYMAQARVRVAPLSVCSGRCGHQCSLSGGVARVAKGRAGNWTFTLEKDVPFEGDGAHRQLVKVTVDRKGYILKMAVSK